MIGSQVIIKKVLVFGKRTTQGALLIAGLLRLVLPCSFVTLGKRLRLKELGFDNFHVFGALVGLFSSVLGTFISNTIQIALRVFFLVLLAVVALFV